MPGPSSKKQAQRTKGNVKPSSSSEAAKLLTEAGTAPTGFIGFGTLGGSPGYVPVSQTLDDVDSSLDSDFRMVLRKLSKRDSTTKVKALQEFSGLCKEKDEDSVKAVLPYWPRIYNKMSLDNDHRVRETTQQAMNTLVFRMRKNLAPFLKSIMGSWLLSQCDTYPTVASMAHQAFQTAFPPMKQTDALVFCKQEATEYLIDNILNQTASTLSDPKTSEPEDMENKYNRVVTSSLLALRKQVTGIPTNQLQSLSDVFDNLLKDSKFWKHGKSSITSVKAAIYTFLAGICQTLPEVVMKHSKKVTTFILHNIDEKDAVVCPCVWEAALSVVSYVDDCWQQINVEKAFWPKLRSFLENGCYGNASLMSGDLLPFLSKVPPTILGEEDKFYIEFFNHMKQGLSKDQVQSSMSELSALVKAYFECTQFVLRSVVKGGDNTGCVDILITDQVLVLVQASLFESSSFLHKSPLYSVISSLFTFLESHQNVAQYQTVMTTFWNELGQSVLDKLTTEMTSDNSHLMERLVQFVRGLINPQTMKKMKSTSKVKFSAEMKEASESFSEVQIHKDLTGGAKQFVHDLTLSAFQIAHTSKNAANLQLFSSLIELVPSEETIREIIENCHGEVSMEESHSSYFVFHVCLPWLHQSQTSLHVNAESKQLIAVICIFVPLLETSVVPKLLDELCKTLASYAVFYYLLEKIIQMENQTAGIKNWLHSNTLGQRLVSIASVVCTESLKDADADEKIIQDGWDIITLILSSGIDRVKSDFIKSILQLIHKSLSDLDQYKGNKADMAVRFVAMATSGFFTHSKDYTLIHSGEDVLLSLFALCIDNNFNLTGKTKQEADAAWTSGIGSLIRQTGGLLQEGSVLCRMVDVIHKQLHRIETLKAFELLIVSAEKMITIMKESLPEDSMECVNNPVIFNYIQQLCFQNQPVMTKKMLEYCFLKGELSFSRVPLSDGSCSLSQALYCSLYNAKLLLNVIKHIEDYDLILSVVHGLTVVQIWREMEKKMFLQFPDLLVGIELLQESTEKLLQGVSECSQNAVLHHALNRCTEDGLSSLCLRNIVPHFTSTAQDFLNANDLIERCSELNEFNVQVLQVVSSYLDIPSCATLTEVMVARIISCNLDTITESNDGVGALCVLNSLLKRMKADFQPDLGKSVLSQVLTWKDQTDRLMLFECNLNEIPERRILANVEIIRFLELAVQTFPSELSDKEWDFILCSAVSLMQTVDESEDLLRTSVLAQAFTIAVCNLIGQLAYSIKILQPSKPGDYPTSLPTEWEEFFSEGIYQTLLPLFYRVTADFRKTTAKHIKGSQECFLGAVSYAVSFCPKQQVLGHKLPAYLVADQLSPLPESLQTLLNHIVPCLSFPLRGVQVAAYHILHSIMPEIPQYDKEENAEVTDIEQTSRCPPVPLIQVIQNNQSQTIATILADLSIEECFVVEAHSEIHQHTLAFMLSWKLLLSVFRSAPAELRSKYAAFFRESNVLNELMSVMFRLMPEIPLKDDKKVNLFEMSAPLLASDNSSSSEIWYLACSVYKDSLRTMPAMVRQWWKDQDRKSANYIDKYTSKYVSPVLCSEEIKSLDKTDHKVDHFTIKTRPATREVIAIHSLEEVCIEIIITLPQNYPLGNISVSSEKKVGVSAVQWDKWLLQLNIFLQHQNGNIMDGLRIWRKNIDKRFEGVDDCMICFSVLHGTNFQLPRLTCKTCKKKFHSACLYKWFQTSHNSTCPLCRNLF